jgi:hypothetical protein
LPAGSTSPRPAAAAPHGAQFTAQPEFTEELEAGQLDPRLQLSRGHEDAERNGQVEAPAVLGEVGGCEIDGDAACGQLEAGIDESGADALLALLHLGAGEADDAEAGQPAAQMHLDRDRRRLQRNLRPAGDPCHGHRTVRRQRLPRRGA